jgi:hypothetical protein
MLVLKLAIAPLVICLATLASRRWGDSIGGWLVALPVTGGPVVLFLAIENGRQFGVAAARGCLSGAVALAGFCLLYAWCARLGWILSVGIGSAGFVALAYLLSRITVRPTLMIGIVLVVVAAVLRLIPDQPPRYSPNSPGTWGLLFRMSAATAVILLLTATGRELGPALSGALASMPVYAGTLAAFAHQSSGPESGVAVLRGLLYGLFGYSSFFLVLDLLMVRHSFALSFSVAFVATGVIHTGALRMMTYATGRQIVIERLE